VPPRGTRAERAARWQEETQDQLRVVKAQVTALHRTVRSFGEANDGATLAQVGKLCAHAALFGSLVLYKQYQKDKCAELKVRRPPPSLPY
jgi:hypothetical protein